MEPGLRARGARPSRTRYRRGVVAKVYITPEGAEKLREELRALWNVERPRVTREVSEAAALGDRSENAEYIYGKKRLREIDRRVRFLRQRLETVTVVRPGEVADHDRVFFGGWVTLEDEAGEERRYRLTPGRARRDRPGSGLHQRSVAPRARADRPRRRRRGDGPAAGGPGHLDRDRDHLRGLTGCSSPAGVRPMSLRRAPPRHRVKITRRTFTPLLVLRGRLRRVGARAPGAPSRWS